MGMYTIFEAQMKLKADTPIEVWETLEWLADIEASCGSCPDNDHPLFKCSRVTHLFRKSGGGGHTHRGPSNPLIDRRRRSIDVGFELKNYSNEIGKFLDWIKPHVQEIQHCIKWYEEMSGPTKITFVDGEYHYKYPEIPKSYGMR